MELGVALLVICLLVIAIWVIFETKRMKHKILAVFLIGLLLFSYFSFTFVFREQEIDFRSLDGIKMATGLYMSWLGTVFLNFKALTANAIHMDWKGNETG